MSLHYILDGYNVIKQTPELSLKEIRVSRQKLYHFLAASNLKGSPQNKITIVFDGRIDYGPGSESPASMEVVFARGRSADEEIKAIVQRAQNPACLVVITNDRDLQFAARAAGARVMPVGEFLAKDKSKRISRTEKDIPLTVAYKINSELSRIWLKPKEKTAQTGRKII